MSSIEDKDGFIVDYWICTPCAKAKGWIPPGNGVTVIRGKCGHCRIPIEQMLTPTRDFRKPGKRDSEWD